ncbi:MAG: lipoyl(octanoyl) transferase LipB [Actinobacteria bacterium]|nr:lipoyl(octanoyl) transferase LipB [Actinomycetota bacterium]
MYAPAVQIQECGVVEYEIALENQRSIHADVVSGKLSNSLLLLEHPSIYTAGKRTQDSEKPTDGTPVINVDRGGKITWHGPGQLVGYPIVRLSNPHELVGFVREIESGLINVCQEFGISTSRIPGRSGVWVVDSRGERKIAAIGIRVASGVTMHGFALNVNPDLSAFSKIIPCGISDADVTSLALEIGAEVSISDVIPVVRKYISQSLAKVSA